MEVRKSEGCCGIYDLYVDDKYYASSHNRENAERIARYWNLAEGYPFDEIERLAVLLEKYGGADAIKRKMKVLEEIEDLILGRYRAVGDMYKVVEIEKLLGLKFQLTVGDLEPGDKHIQHSASGKKSAVCEMCWIPPKIVNCDFVVFLNMATNRICTTSKSTPCERIDD